MNQYCSLLKSVTLIPVKTFNSMMIQLDMSLYVIMRPSFYNCRMRTSLLTTNSTLNWSTLVRLPTWKKAGCFLLSVGLWSIALLKCWWEISKCTHTKGSSSISSTSFFSSVFSDLVVTLAGLWYDITYSKHSNPGLWDGLYSLYPC